MLQSMGLHRDGHDLATEQQQQMDGYHSSERADGSSIYLLFVSLVADLVDLAAEFPG